MTLILDLNMAMHSGIWVLLANAVIIVALILHICCGLSFVKMKGKKKQNITLRNYQHRTADGWHANPG
jgi:hypothetical protein